MDQVVTDKTSTEDLLDVVYDVSANPSSFQTLSTAFELWVWPKIKDAENTNLQQYFAAHFERAESILARISSTKPDTPLSETLSQFDEISKASVLFFDNALRIVTGTGAAGQAFS